MANSSALVQARGISNAHCLPGQHAYASVHRTNGPEELGQYTALLMSEDADAHTHERAVAGRRKRVQGPHTVSEAACKWEVLLTSPRRQIWTSYQIFWGIHGSTQHGGAHGFNSPTQG